MTPEKWREVERLYYAALERDADERAAFLTDACAADDALRREVESLFAYQAKARDFIEKPAVHIRLASALRGLEPLSVAGRFVGRVFGCYELKALIAAGGMGEVYRAVDTRLNRTVAIKTLPEHLSNDPARRERFTREAKIVSSLNHPHICTLYDVGMQDDIQYLVMEHIDGETLRKRLERGPLPLARALEYSIEICDALDKAHRRGVIHRDLNPANIMLTASGVKLLDFGLAGPRTPAGETTLKIPTEHRSEGLTADGTIMGTLPYISPEQLEGKRVDVRSDIFAFGGVAYEMITGIRAFRAESQAGLMSAILKDNPQPIVELVADVSLPLAQALSRCLAKDPDERWQTANDLLFQLRSIASSPAALDARESAARRRPRWIERAMWTTVVVVSIVGMFLWARSRDVRSLDPAQGNRDPLQAVPRRRHGVLFQLRSAICAVPGRPPHRLCECQSRRDETTVASLSVFRAGATDVRDRRGELAVLVDRQPVDRFLRRQQPEESPRFNRAHTDCRQRSHDARRRRVECR